MSKTRNIYRKSALQVLFVFASFISLPVLSFADEAVQNFGGYDAAKKSIITPSSFSTPGLDVSKGFDLQGEDLKILQQINVGAQLNSARNPVKAIEIYDQIISFYEQKYKDEKAVLYCARTPTESLFYSMSASTKGKDVKIISSNWAYAYFLKAYSLVDLGRGEEAKTLLDRAITLSPKNAQFLAEIGNYYQRQKDWSTSLEYYQKSEDAAQNNFSPSAAKNNELARAWRGQGFVYTEKNQLDDAKKEYQKCLELNSNDMQAKNELNYIAGLEKNWPKAPIKMTGDIFGKPSFQ